MAWTTGEKLTFWGIVVPIAATFIVFFYLNPTQQEEELRAEGFQATGDCKVDRKTATGNKRNSYFVIVQNTGSLSFEGVKVSASYYGGDKADVELEPGIDPPAREFTTRKIDQNSVGISLEEQLPPGGKVTFHVGDVIAKDNSPDKLPDLDVSVWSKTSASISIVWSCN